MRFLFNLLLTAAAITFIFPHIEGVSFAGSLPAALGIAFVFTGSLWVVKQVARALALSLGLTALLPGLLVLIPLAVFGMWALPAAELMMFSSFSSAALSVDGWVTAFLAGLVLFLINSTTHNWSDTLRKPCCKK